MRCGIGTGVACTGCNRIFFISSFPRFSMRCVAGLLTGFRGRNLVLQVTGNICIGTGGAQFKIMCPSTFRLMGRVTGESGTVIVPAKRGTTGELNFSARIPVGTYFVASNAGERLGLKGEAVALGRNTPGGFTCGKGLVPRLIRTLHDLKRSGVASIIRGEITRLLSRAPRARAVRRSLLLTPM